MSPLRLFVDAELTEGARLALTLDQAHYVITVMRRSTGDELHLFNGRDGEWDAKLIDSGRKTAAVTIATQRRAQRRTPDLHLLFAPIKKARTDFIVEKAAELGAAQIRPVMTRRTIAERVNTDRLSAIAREAAEQSERLDVPVVRAPVKLSQALAAWPENEGGRRLLFCDEWAGEAHSPWRSNGASAPPALRALFAAPDVNAGAWAILIGPEGGFAPDEQDSLRQAPFVTPVTLGPRVLRADTAAVAALTIWQSVLGDWS